MKKERNSNLELLRIVAILMIILGHVIHHGNMIRNTDSEFMKNLLQFIEFMNKMHVSLFIIITGYFQCKSKFRISKFIRLIIQTLLYSILILVLGIKFGWITNYNSVYLLKNIGPDCIANYWFINCYLILYLFSDYINILISKLEKKKYQKLLIISFIVLSIVPFLTGGGVLNNTGTNFYHFIFLYLIGAYIRIYSIKPKKIKKTSVYRILLFACFCICGISNHVLHVTLPNHVFSENPMVLEILARIRYTYSAYSTPFVIIQGISLFELFNTFNFKSKIINFISASTLGIYMIHDNPIIRANIYNWLKINVKYSGTTMLSNMVISVVIIFVVCLFIDIIRRYIFLIFEKCYDKIISIRKQSLIK